MTADQVIVVNAHKLAEVPAGYTLIYVGRRSSYRPELGLDFSVLGNPFGPRGGYSRDEAVEAFEARVKQGLPLVPRRALDILRERARTERLALVWWLVWTSFPCPQRRTACQPWGQT